MPLQPEILNWRWTGEHQLGQISSGLPRPDPALARAGRSVAGSAGGRENDSGQGRAEWVKDQTQGG